MEYQVKFHPAALQEFCKLDGSIKKTSQETVRQTKKISSFG